MNEYAGERQPWRSRAEDGPQFALLFAVDDATGGVPNARWRWIRRNPYQQRFTKRRIDRYPYDTTVRMDTLTVVCLY